MEPAGPDAVIDRELGAPESEELPARESAVLSS
jgi:hypothetical protein